MSTLAGGGEGERCFVFCFLQNRTCLVFKHKKSIICSQTTKVHVPFECYHISLIIYVSFWKGGRRYTNLLLWRTHRRWPAAESSKGLLQQYFWISIIYLKFHLKQQLHSQKDALIHGDGFCTFIHVLFRFCFHHGFVVVQIFVELGNVLLFSRAPKISNNFTAPFHLFDFSKSRTRQFFLA